MMSPPRPPIIPSASHVKNEKNEKSVKSMGAHLFSSWTTLFSLWAITWSKAGSTINVQSNWSFLPCSPVRKLLELTAVLITSAAAVQSHQLESFLGSFPPRSLSSRTHQTESGKMGRFHGRGPLSWLTPCLITMDRNLVRCFDPRCLFEPFIEDGKDRGNSRMNLKVSHDCCCCCCQKLLLNIVHKSEMSKAELDV